MCLAVPGLIKSITGDDPLLRRAIVDFSGIEKEISLAYVPEAKVGDYVVIHVGFAISILDEEEARRNLEYIAEVHKLEQEGQK